VHPMIMFSTRDLTVRRQATCFRLPWKTVKTTWLDLARLTCGLVGLDHGDGRQVSRRGWVDGCKEVFFSKRSPSNASQSAAALCQHQPARPQHILSLSPLKYPYPCQSLHLLSHRTTPCFPRESFPVLASHPRFDPNTTHDLDVHLDVTSVLGQASSWALNSDGPRLDVDGDPLGDVQSLDRGDVFHFCPIIPSNSSGSLNDRQ
jgi:hypothetical protein